MESNSNENMTTFGSNAVVKAGPVKEFLGVLATKKFWIDIAVVVVCEAANAFFSAVKDAILLYAKKRKSNSDSEAIKNISIGQTGATQSSPSSAFSGGFSPRPAYTPNYSQQPTPPPPTYPGMSGFGS